MICVTGSLFIAAGAIEQAMVIWFKTIKFTFNNQMVEPFR